MRAAKNTLQENGSSAAIVRYSSMTKFPWKLKYMAKYTLKAFFLTTFPSTQKKCPKIHAVTLVLPLNPLRYFQYKYNNPFDHEKKSENWSNTFRDMN